MKIMMIGDIYSSNGRDIVEKVLPVYKKQNKIDFVVANGENTTHGKSIIEKHYEMLKQFGIDVISSGNHIFDLKEAQEIIEQHDDLLRPYNMNKYVPGNGYVIKECNGKKICILNMIGTSFMGKANNPYEAMDEFLNKKLDYDMLFIDFHAEATAEKMAFAWNYDGKITGFVGTHTHVQTADERLLPKGTGYITDLGFTGAYDSIIGADPVNVIKKEMTGLPNHFEPANSLMKQLCGVIFTVDDKTNKVTDVERVFVKDSF